MQMMTSEIAISNQISDVTKLRTRLSAGRDSNGVRLDHIAIDLCDWWVITGYQDRLEMGGRLAPTVVEKDDLELVIRDYEQYQQLSSVYGYPCRDRSHAVAVCAIVDGLQLVEMGSASVNVQKPLKFQPTPRLQYGCERPSLVAQAILHRHGLC